MTLLEILLTTAMVALVGLTFAGIYITSQRFLIQSTIFSSSNSEATFAIEHMKRRIVRANRLYIYLPAAGEFVGTKLAIRYDHKTGGAQTPNDVNDDEWDCYSLQGDSTLRYSNNFHGPQPPSGANQGRNPPPEPDMSGAEVIARNIILSPDNDLFRLLNNGGIVVISFTAHQQSSNQLFKDTKVIYRVNPRGVPAI